MPRQVTVVNEAPFPSLLFWSKPASCSPIFSNHHCHLVFPHNAPQSLRTWFLSGVAVQWAFREVCYICYLLLGLKLFINSNLDLLVIAVVNIYILVVPKGATGIGTPLCLELYNTDERHCSPFRVGNLKFSYLGYPLWSDCCQSVAELIIHGIVWLLPRTAVCVTNLLFSVTSVTKLNPPSLPNSLLLPSLPSGSIVHSSFGHASVATIYSKQVISSLELLQ